MEQTGNQWTMDKEGASGESGAKEEGDNCPVCLLSAYLNENSNCPTVSRRVSQ